MGTKYRTPEEKIRQDALRRVIRKVTGGYCFGKPRCRYCGKEFTEDELLAEELVWAVGKGSSAQFHRECFRKEFGVRGGNVCLSM